MDTSFSVAGVGYGQLWGIETRDMGRDQIIKDLATMLMRVKGSHLKK